jgi:hypothetical protein
VSGIPGRLLRGRITGADERGLIAAAA